MKIYSKKWLFILACFLFSGCTEEFKIDDEHVPNISITGRITNLDKKHYIFIKQGSSLQGTTLKPYENAKVSVQDNKGQETRLFARGGGEYSLYPNLFSVKIGDSYRLKIQLKDKKFYYSEWQELLPPVEVNDLTYREGPKRYIATTVGVFEQLQSTYEIVSNITNSYTSKQFVYFEESGEFEYASFPWLYKYYDAFAREYSFPKECCQVCWVTDMKRIKYNGLYPINKGEINSVIAGIVPIDVYRFNQGKYRSTITQHTVGKKEFNFLQQIKDQVNSGGIFDSQPSQIKGNIYQDGNPEIRLNGYFGVSSAIEKSIFIKRSKIPQKIYEEYNDDCRLLIYSHRFLKSTAIKPSYWE